MKVLVSVWLVQGPLETSGVFIDIFLSILKMITK